MQPVDLQHCDTAQETWKHRLFVSSCFIALQLAAAAAVEWEEFFPAVRLENTCTDQKMSLDCKKTIALLVGDR